MIVLLYLLSNPGSPKKPVISTKRSGSALPISRWLLPRRRAPNSPLEALAGDHLLASLQILDADLASTFVLVSVAFLSAGIDVHEIGLAARILDLLIDLVRVAELVVAAVVLPRCSGDACAVAVGRASVGCVVSSEIVVVDDFVGESVLVPSSLLH